ncbi:DUF72 domain-containing protein [Pseudomonas lini]
MLQPYYLGCPSWSENVWRDYLYPQDARPAEFLNLYSQVFNAVEGNTTFYASPSAATVQRWAETMPEHFRFTAKFPGDISHSGDLREQLTAAETFLQLLSPLGERVSPLWLQLSKSFTPQRLSELAGFIDAVDRPLAVEVRHDEFFAKGDAERMLNRLLLDRGVERICLDPRALFSCTSTDPSVLHAQSKKSPGCRLDLLRLLSFHRCVSSAILCLKPTIHSWCRGSRKIAVWIEEGRTPYIFLHTADNLLAAKLAQRFHAQLMLRLPGLPPLPELYREPAAEQLGLL